MLRIYLTGRMAIEGSALVDESDLPGPQGRLVLAVLALARSPVARGDLASIVWAGDPPSNWDATLTPILSKLRAALVRAGGERGLVASSSGAVELRRTGGVWVDLEHATNRLDAAEGFLRRGEWARAWPAAAVATAVFRRPLLAGVEVPWAVEWRRACRTRLVRALEVTVDVWMATGDPGQAVTAARQLVAADPFRETGYERLMRAHMAEGNRAEALRVFAACDRLLVAELGVEPSRRLQEVYEQVLAGGQR